jgi:hypothetical protein
MQGRAWQPVPAETPSAERWSSSALRRTVRTRVTVSGARAASAAMRSLVMAILRPVEPSQCRAMTAATARNVPGPTRAALSASRPWGVVTQ